MIERRVVTMRLESWMLPLCQSILISTLVLLILGDCNGLRPQPTILDKHKAKGLVLESVSDGSEITNDNTARRKFVRQLFGAAMSSTLVNSSPSLSSASTTTDPNDSIRHPFAYSDSWTGTRMKIMSLEDATNSDAYTRDDSRLYWAMGKWPDPALRIPARPVDPSMWSAGALSEQQQKLQLAATILRDTARREGAVGLAAQQCGVDARMVYLSASGGGRFGNENDLVLVNPRIVARSPESNMKVWTEECLVLPPTFRATVLRDDWIDVEYDFFYEYRSPQDKTRKQTLASSSSSSSPELVVSGGSGSPIQRRFVKEQSRCLQHELDHDRGILITDHVGLDELENNVMRRIETEGHDRRQALAYSR